MKKTIREIVKSFKDRPVWTTYSLILSPFYYLMVALTAVLLGLIVLDIDAVKNFWNENT